MASAFMFGSLAALIASVAAAIPETASADPDTTSAVDDWRLSRHEQSSREFLRLERDGVASYFHQRTLGEAVVEGDFIRYLIDAATGDLMEKTVRWRAIPDSLPVTLGRNEIEMRFPGTVESSRLHVVSPESAVLPLDPSPENPCWVVRGRRDGTLVITVYDAVSGDSVGVGVPPPAPSVAFSGPLGQPPEPCWGAWRAWINNAEIWFNQMGYPVEKVIWPSEITVRSCVQSDEVALFYEMGHGHSWRFHNECPFDIEHAITSAEVESWLQGYASLPLTFLGSCDAMCDQSDGTFAHEFRLGSNEDAVVVGYCGMGSVACEDCWSYSIQWQNALLGQLAQGSSVETALNASLLAFPVCAPCVDLAGDGALRVVPPLTRSLCGEIFDGQKGPLIPGGRAYYVRCDLLVPDWRTLHVQPGAELVMMGGARVESRGELELTGGPGEIRLMAEGRRADGVAVRGIIRMTNGGTMRLHP